MRIRGLFVVVTVAGLLAVMSPGAAMAGGNWLDIRRDDGVRGGQWQTFPGPFLPGTALEVRARLYVQSERAADRLRTSGPYYAWIAPVGGRVDDREIQTGALRVSVFAVHWPSGSASPVARTSFVLPALPSGDYTIEVCNDPCTLSGFGDFVQGWTSIVQSAEAAKLHRQRDRFHFRFNQARADAGRAHREAERLQADLDAGEGERAALTARIAVLTDQLDSVRRRVEATTTPVNQTLVDPWVGVLLGIALLSLAAMIRFRYRARRIVVPDTLEELLVSDGFESRTAKR
jgi:hypothetical protein